MSTLALSLVVLTPSADRTRQVGTGTMTIRLVSTTTYVKVITDRPPARQVNKGDVLVVESTLRNAVAQFGRRRGAAVGFDTVIFTMRSRRETDVIVASKLPGGELRAAGRTRLGGKQTYSVTGGTGRFANARGTGASIALAVNGDRRLKLYRLQLR